MGSAVNSRIGTRARKKVFQDTPRYQRAKFIRTRPEVVWNASGARSKSRVGQDPLADAVRTNNDIQDLRCGASLLPWLSVVAQHVCKNGFDLNLGSFEVTLDVSFGAEISTWITGESLCRCRPHADFRLFACMNPQGPQASAGRGCLLGLP